MCVCVYKPLQHVLPSFLSFLYLRRRRRHLGCHRPCPCTQTNPSNQRPRRELHGLRSNAMVQGARATRRWHAVRTRSRRLGHRCASSPTFSYFANPPTTFSFSSFSHDLAHLFRRLRLCRIGSRRGFVAGEIWRRPTFPHPKDVRYIYLNHIVRNAEMRCLKKIARNF